MVVCKCRKATKLYCFVHKAPVCGECIAFPEHKLCVVKTYSDWVIDGDYDWPPKCSLCQQILEETDDVTRLGCFHILHSKCLEDHLKSYPPHTAPAGYMCPTCSTPIWPPKLGKDANSGLQAKLIQIITQSGLASTLIGSDLTALSSTQQGSAPPAFSSPALAVARTPADGEESNSTASASAAAEGDVLTTGQAVGVGEGGKIHEEVPETSSSAGLGASAALGSGSAPPATKTGPPPPPPMLQLQNGAMARKNLIRGDNLSSSALEYENDEDGSNRKYTRRGPLHHQVMRSLLPIWSPALPTLPVTSPGYQGKRDGPAAEDIIDGRSRRKQRNTTTIDLRKLLLWLAIMSCMATALLLYYRLVQGFGSSSTSDSTAKVEDQ